MSTVITPPEFLAEPPKQIKRPCDWGLVTAIDNLEVQLGTLEAYNRLAVAARELKAKIDAGHVRPQNPIYATDARGAVENNEVSGRLPAQHGHDAGQGERR